VLTLTRETLAPAHEIDLRDRQPAPVRQPAPGPFAYGLAAVSVAAAAIHAAFIPDHLEEAWIFGAFFIACTIVQLAQAYLFATTTARWVYSFGLLTNLAVMFVWLVSRTTGLPFGPMPGVPEAVGAPDMLCGVLEGAIVVRCAWLLAGDHWRWKDRWTQQTMVRLAGLVGVIALSTAASLSPPLNHHHHPDVMTSDTSMRRPGMATSIGNR
jgi:hypothetical protein